MSKLRDHTCKDEQIQKLIDAIDPDIVQCAMCEEWFHIDNTVNLGVQTYPDVSEYRYCKSCVDDIVTEKET